MRGHGGPPRGNDMEASSEEVSQETNHRKRTQKRAFQVKGIASAKGKKPDKAWLLELQAQYG